MRLIAESGSTKTHWVLIGSNGLQRFSSVGINPYYVDAIEVARLLKPIFDHELFLPIQEVYFYGTGITDASKSQIISDGLKLAFGYAPDIHTYSDIIASAIAIHGNSKGIACILGTGSNSCLWDGTSIIHQVPPLGFWLGDEGSGGHLGKILVQAYLHHHFPTDLREIFEQKYGILKRQDILQKAYKEPNPNKYFAGFTPFYTENKHISFLKDLLLQSFQSYFDLYIKKYPNSEQHKLGFVGSIAYFFNLELQEIASKNGFKAIECIQSPIDRLVVYHQE